MTNEKQSENKTREAPAYGYGLEQHGQMDFFINDQTQQPDALESALDQVARERAQSIKEWASFLDEYDVQLMQSPDELKTVLRVILWDQAQIASKLKAVLNVYSREMDPKKPFLRKYHKDILSTFNLLPDNDIQHYLRKVNIADNMDEAIASDWSNVFGDLHSAFNKENQRDSQQDR